MSVANIWDHRSNKYDVRVDVYIEPSFRDNVCAGATQFPIVDVKNFCVENIINVTVAEAIQKGNEYDFPVTIYLYDAESSLLDIKTLI